MEEVESEGGLVTGEFEEGGPGESGGEPCLHGNECATQDGEVAVEVEVFAARGVFSKLGVAHPVVSALASAPVATDERSEALRFLRRQAADVVVGGGLRFASCRWLGTTAAGDLGHADEAAHVRQSAA